MALYNIFRTRIGDVSDVDYPIGYIVYTKWNDNTNNFVVHLHNAGDVYVATRTIGPDLSVDDYILVEYDFEFCSGSTLNTFTFNPVVFPYAERIETAGASQCRTKHICSVSVTDVTTTNASTSTAADGEAVITVDGADAPYYYSLTSDFLSQQTSSTFTGLAPGNYTAYAKSQDYPNCVSNKSFVIGFDSDYGVRYRGEFDSALQHQLPGYEYRIDILERGFVGSVTEVCMGSNPIVINWQGQTEDKYKPIIPSKATIQLMSEANFYFADLFTGDERQFLVKFYINDGSGLELEWTGYLLQQGYEEDYKAPPFVVTLVATDGLADLTEVEYDDLGDKSLMRILSGLISQTDLNLNIRSAVNIYEENHDNGAGDDPLDQTYINTYFRGGSYYSMVEDILKPFGARIFQSQGYWWIIRIEDSVASSLPYREFTPSGVYSSNTTASLRTNIDFPDVDDRLMWTGVPLFRIRAGYKNAKVIHTLGLDNNLFFEGRLHIDDFNEDTGLFNGIGVSLGSSVGATYGLQITKNGDSEHCLYIDLSQADILAAVGVFTEDKTIDSDNFKDTFKLSFDYLVSPQLRCEYIKFDWALQLSTGYVLDNFTNHVQYNSIYTSNFFAWQKFEKDLGTLDTTSLNFTFVAYANHPYNASSLAELELLDTDLLDAGEKRIALDNIGGDLHLRHYTLQYTTDERFSPNIIEPDDYATSKKKWFLDITTPFSLLLPNVGFVLIDNIRVQFFPEGLDPEETEVYEIVINSRNKENYEVGVNLGDLPDTSNAVHIYKNYFKLSDGTPTTLWSRATISESKPILEILSIDLAAQNDIGIRLLNGQLVGDKIHRFHNCFIDVFDSDRTYANMGLEVDYLNNLYNLEIIEVKTGVTNEPPAEGSAFTNAFSSAFESAS